MKFICLSITYRNLVLAALTLFLLSGVIAAQSSSGGRRDYLTPEEVDRVKEAQLIDARVKVFIKAADRRMSALTDASAATSKQAVKDTEKWGAFPTGTRAELINDFVGILDAAIDNIENASEHKADAKKLAAAITELAAACRRWLPHLSAMHNQSKELGERNQLERAVEFAESVLEAENKPPSSN